MHATNLAAIPAPRGREALADELARVERLLSEESGGPLPLMDAVAGHLLGAGGKRLRPTLCLLAGRLAAVPERERVVVAAVSELIHTASLLHDDVVDEAPLRRGRTAAPRVFGNSSCVLMGDALMARSLTLLGELPSRTPLVSLARCVRRMALGELAQLARAGTLAPGLLAYGRVIEGKTSALFAWCATVGGLAPAPLRSPLARFGRRLGMAFQIGDDLLDLDGDPARTGKEVGADLAQGKPTLPIFIACRARPALAQAVAELLARGAAPGREELAALIDECRASGALAETRRLVATLLTRARRALEELPPGEWRDELALVAGALAGRER